MQGTGALDAGSFSYAAPAAPDQAGGEVHWRTAAGSTAARPVN
jgi:hypothetical protein